MPQFMRLFPWNVVVSLKKIIDMCFGPNVIIFTVKQIISTFELWHYSVT